MANTENLLNEKNVKSSFFNLEKIKAKAKKLKDQVIKINCTTQNKKALEREEFLNDAKEVLEILKTKVLKN